MTNEKGPDVAQCPFCPMRTAGVNCYPTLASHVKKVHPDKVKEFKKIPRKDVITMGEADKTPPQTQPQTPPVQQEETPPTQMEQHPLMPPPPAVQEPTPPIQQIQPPVLIPAQQQPLRSLIRVPVLSPPEPEEWMEQFLSQYEKMKGDFIVLQKQRVQQTKELPHPMDFERYLISFDSGYKNKQPEAAYIRTFYETALKQYLKERNVQPPSKGYDMHQQDRDYAPGAGIPIRQNPYDYQNPYDQYRQQPPPYYPPPSKHDEIHDMRMELQRMNEERQRQQQQEMERLRTEVSSAGQRNPEFERLEAKLEQQAIEYRHVLEELQKQKENTLLDKIGRIELMAKSGPSAEEIQRWLDQKVQAEHDRITATDIEKKIHEIVNAGKGITQIDVDLKKAEHTFELEGRKIDSEREKAGMWSTTLKDAAGALGQGIGSMIGQKQEIPPEQPQEQPQENQITCPSCGLLLEVPPDVKNGFCQRCNSKLMIDDLGNVSIYQETPPPMQPREPTPPPAESNQYAFPPPKQQPEQQPPEYQPPPKPVEIEPPKQETSPEQPSSPMPSAETLPEQPPESPPKQEIPVQPPLPPEPVDDEDYVGPCTKCGKPIYETGPKMNIGRVEAGKPYCKECS